MTRCARTGQVLSRVRDDFLKFVGPDRVPEVDLEKICDLLEATYPEVDHVLGVIRVSERQRNEMPVALVGIGQHANSINSYLRKNEPATRARLVRRHVVDIGTVSSVCTATFCYHTFQLDLGDPNRPLYVTVPNSADAGTENWRGEWSQDRNTSGLLRGRGAKS